MIKQTLLALAFLSGVAAVSVAADTAAAPKADAKAEVKTINDEAAATAQLAKATEKEAKALNDKETALDKVAGAEKRLAKAIEEEVEAKEKLVKVSEAASGAGDHKADEHHADEHKDGQEGGKEEESKE